MSSFLWPCVLSVLLLSQLLSTNISSLLFLIGILLSVLLGIACYLLLRLHFDQSYFQGNQTPSLPRALLKHQHLTLFKAIVNERESKSPSIQLNIASKSIVQLSEELIDLILDDYILYWFDYLLPDSGRKNVRNQLRLDLVSCVNNVCDRLGTIDLVHLAVSVLNILTRHFEALRAVEVSKRSKNEVQGKGFKLKSYLANDKTELDYLTSVAEVFLILCCSPHYSRSKHTRDFLKHTLAIHVLKPLIELVTMPEFINTKVVRFIQRSKRQRAVKSKDMQKVDSNRRGDSTKNRFDDETVREAFEKFVAADIKAGHQVLSLAKTLNEIDYDDDNGVTSRIQGIQTLMTEVDDGCDEELRMSLQPFRPKDWVDFTNKSDIKHLSSLLHTWMRCKSMHFITSANCAAEEDGFFFDFKDDTKTLADHIEAIEERIQEIKMSVGLSSSSEEMQLLLNRQLKSAELGLALLREHQSAYKELWQKCKWKCKVSRQDKKGFIVIEVSAEDRSGDLTRHEERRVMPWNIRRDISRLREALVAVLSGQEKDHFVTQNLRLLQSNAGNTATLEFVLNNLLTEPRFRNHQGVFIHLLPLPNYDQEQNDDFDEEDDYDGYEDDDDDEMDAFRASGPPGGRDLGAAANAVYRLVGEVFDLRGVFRLLRKSLMTFVQITYGSSMGRKVRDVSLWLGSESMIVYYLYCFKKAYSHTKAADTVDAETTKQLLLQNLPEMLVALVGHQTAVMGVTKVFDAFQKQRLNKQLFYHVLEFSLQQLFPELLPTN